MIYRRAQRDDLPTLKKFEKEAMATAPKGLFWQAGNGIVGGMLPVDFIFVATEGDEVVGMLGAIPVNDVYWYVADFYVDPIARGRGVGRGLMDAAAAYHRQNGRLRALATPNPTALDTYEHLGFRPIAQTVEWDYS